MSAAREIVQADRRRAILVALSIAPGYTLPERATRIALRAQVEAIGYTVSLDMLRSDVAALEEIGLADTFGLMGSVKLTDRGLDVVMGRSQVPGVRRPEPGEV